MVEDTEKLEISCGSCGAKIVVEPVQRTSRCLYCDSPAVIDRPATTDRPDPVFAIGFSVDRQGALARVREFLRRRKLAPKGLRRAVAEKVRGVYAPGYLYSAISSSRYGARIGEDYWVTETTRDSKGRTRVRRKRKTEIRNLQGLHRTYVGDVVVSASRGIPNDELEAVEPFDLADLRRYAPGMVAGWISEEPTLTREECLDLARGESRTKVGGSLRAFMPGDSVRGLDHSTELDNESADLTLLPLWIFAMRYAEGKPPVRILVSGQTGKVWGDVPTSWAKIGFIVAVVLGLLAVPVFLALLAGVLG